jgi:hypothetical protein
MDYIPNNLKKLALASICTALISTPVLADAIWHCSRSDVQIADASDNFTLASLNFEREVIRMSLRDLYEVYKGVPVKMTGNQTLSACIAGNANQTSLMMKSIGAESIASQILSNSNASTYSNIYIVQSEAEMETCISQHHPAVGYFSRVKNTEVVGPCF